MTYEKIFRSGEGIQAFGTACLLVAFLIALLPDPSLCAGPWSRKENVPTVDVSAGRFLRR